MRSDLIAAVSSMLCVGGCSTEASVHLKDGSVVQGELVGGTRDHLKLDVAGDEVAVPRANVEEVDHPGNGAAWAGGAVALAGLPLTIFGATYLANEEWRGCSPERPCAILVGAFTGIGGAMLISGTISLTWGLLTWNGSTEAAEDADDGSAQLTPDVTLAPGAASLRWSF